MNLRHLALFIGLFVISSLAAQVTDNISKGFLSKFNQTRQVNSLTALEYDSTLSVSCMEIEEEHFKETKLNDDYIRSVLRSNGNFDYNINLVEIETRNIENTLNKSLESINTNLEDILNNPGINKVGVWSKEVGKKHRILLLFSESYIVFDKYFIHELHATPDGGRKFIVIPGKSRIEDITYNLHGKELDKTKSVSLDQRNEFRIKIEITSLSKDSPRLIEFKTSDGKTVSLVNF